MMPLPTRKWSTRWARLLRIWAALGHRALAWLLQRPGVTAPIVGATKAHHLEDAIAALAVQLDAQTIAALEDKYIPHAMSFSG